MELGVTDKFSINAKAEIFVFNAKAVPDHTTFRYYRYGQDCLREVNYHKLRNATEHYTEAR